MPGVVDSAVELALQAAPSPVPDFLHRSAHCRLSGPCFGLKVQQTADCDVYINSTVPGCCSSPGFMLNAAVFSSSSSFFSFFFRGGGGGGGARVNRTR